MNRNLKSDADMVSPSSQVSALQISRISDRRAPSRSRTGFIAFVCTAMFGTVLFAASAVVANPLVAQQPEEQTPSGQEEGGDQSPGDQTGGQPGEQQGGQPDGQQGGQQGDQTGGQQGGQPDGQQGGQQGDQTGGQQGGQPDGQQGGQQGGQTETSTPPTSPPETSTPPDSQTNPPSGQQPADPNNPPDGQQPPDSQTNPPSGQQPADPNNPPDGQQPPDSQNPPDSQTDPPDSQQPPEPETSTSTPPEEETAQQTTSNIVFTAPDNLWVTAGFSKTFDVSSYAVDGSNTITCQNATAADSTRITGITRTGCSFRVTAGTTLGSTSFTVPYVSSGGDTHSGAIPVHIISARGTQIPALSSTGCTNGTYVDTTANPRVAGNNNDLVEDCLALVALQNSWASATNTNMIDGHALRRWGVGKVSDWPAITVETVSGASRVTKLESVPSRFGTNDFRIIGPLPSDIGKLTALTVLNLGNNRLSSIPTEITSLTSLTELNLGGNRRMTGFIPSNIGNLTGLTTLNLADNMLRGPIPTTISSLTSLTELALQNNELIGTIPPSLGNLTSLTKLFLDNNALSGTIPTQLGSLTALTHLYLNDNQLTGSIPTQFGSLTALTNLYLNDNRLSGSIPTQIGSLTALTHLHLDNNRLTGAIPTQISSLTAVEELKLHKNELSGALPSQLATLVTSSALRTLSICTNKFTGNVPTGLRTVVTLEDYPTSEGYEPVKCQASPLPSLSNAGCTNGTYFSSSVPRVSGDDNDLAEDCISLVAAYNAFATATQNQALAADHPMRTWGVGSTIRLDQDKWSGITVRGNRITRIRMGNFDLGGPIPTDLGKLTGIKGLNLSDNRLTGSIPTSFGNLTILRHELWLHNNQLTGTIPTQLGSLTQLRNMNLSNNGLTGTIPTQLGSMTAMQILDLSQNSLWGSIPTQLSSLSALRQLHLNDNLLSGLLPAQLNSIAAPTGLLSVLSICNNYLTGAVPLALRTSSVSLTNYPTASGYSTVGCQNTGNPPSPAPQPSGLPTSNIVVTTPPLIEFSRYIAVSVDLSGYATDGPYQVSCGDATSISFGFSLTWEGGCSYRLYSGNVTTGNFVIPYTSSGGDTATGTIRIASRAFHFIRFNALTGLSIGADQEIAIDLTSRISASAGTWRVGCIDASSVSDQINSISRKGCVYTIRAGSTQGTFSFQANFRSYGAQYSFPVQSAFATISFTVGPPSNIVFNAPSNLSVSNNSNLVVNAATYATDGTYTISCEDATDIHAKISNITRTGCSYTVTAGARGGTATFTVPYVSTGGDTHDGEISITINAPSSILFTAPTNLETSVGSTITVDASLYADDGTFTVSCGTATSVSSLITINSRNGCSYNITAGNTQGTATFTVPYSSSGSTTASGTISITIGPASNIVFTAPTNLVATLGGTIVVPAGDYVTDGSYTITCSEAVQLNPVTNNRETLNLAANNLASIVAVGCNYAVTVVNTAGTASFTVPYNSTGGDSHLGTISITISGTTSNIVFTAPTGLKVAANRTLTIDAADYATDGSFTVSCGDATNIGANAPTSGTVALTSVVRDTSGNGCGYTITPTSAQGTAAFTIPYSSSGGHTLDATVSLTVGPNSTIVYSAPSGLRVGRNQTLEINALSYVTENSAYTVSCGDATGVASARLSVTHTGDSCTFTIDPVDTIGAGLQGSTSFTIPYTSDGGATATGSVSVFIGPDSALTFTDPGTFTLGRNRTLVIDASAAVSGENAAYTVSCADATGVDATKIAVTRSGCSFTVDPVDTLTPANQGDATFSVAFASTGGATASGTFTVNIGPDSTITYTAPPSTGAGSLQVARNQTLEIDASSYVSESGSSYTITCSDARNLTVSRLTSVTRTANTCRYTITPNTSASTGNASFTITYTSTGGHSIVRTITLRVGPDSAISYNAPSGLSVAAGRGIAIAVSGYVSDGANTFTCADASGQDITDGHISVARNGCVFTVSAAASAAGENVTFTVLVTSSGGSSLSVSVPLAITAVSSIVFTDPAGGVNIGAGNSKVIDVGSFAADGTYTLQCRFNESTRHSRIASVTTDGCSFTVRAGTTQGAATLSVLYNSSGGDEATGVVTVTIGASSIIYFNVPGSSSLPVVAGGAAVTVNAGSYVTDGSYTISCGDATAVSATITVVRTGCSFAVTALASASGVVRFDVPYVSDGGNARSGTIRMAVSKVAYTAPVGLSVASRGLMVFDASEYATDGSFTISCSDATIPSSAHQARITSVTRTGCSYEVRAANATGVVDIRVPYTSTGGATGAGLVRVNLGNIRALSSTNCSNGTFVDTTENPRVSGTNNDLVEDCEALVAMYENWRSVAANSNLRSSYFLRTWGAGSASQRLVENWEGVTVTSGRVTGLDLENFGEEDGISGTIHTTIGNLRALTSLNLADHQLSGSIPSQLYSLTSLTDLDLSYNSLSGTLSTSLGSLTALTSLILSDNSLTGNIPTQITSLTALTNLDLSDNSLDGAIPTGIGSLTALTQLALGDNSLTGEIPSGISSLTALTNLFLNDNDLTGEIPTGIGSLTALTFLDLSENDLSGEIPTQFGSLTVLVSLYLNDNRLRGSVPSQIATLITTDSGKLAALAICENQLTGALPTALRTPALLVDYPTDDGYNPIACQNDPSSITFTAPTGLTIGRNYTLAINALDHVSESDSSQTISCADATGVDATKMTVTRGTGANSCVFTVDPVNTLSAADQGDATFSVLFTSTGGSTEIGTFTVNIGPDSSIRTVNLSTTQAPLFVTATNVRVNFSRFADDGDYEIFCTSVSLNRGSISNRAADSCIFDYARHTTGAAQATFNVSFRSAGGATATASIVISRSSGLYLRSFSFPTPNIPVNTRTEINAGSHIRLWTSNTYFCFEPTNVDSKITVILRGCRYIITAGSTQGAAPFTVNFRITSGEVRTATVNVNVGPPSNIVFTAPTGLKVGRNRTLDIDASDHAADSNYTISCDDATGVDASKMTVTRGSGANSCVFTVDPVNSLSSANQGNATFSVPFTSSAGDTATGQFTVNIGPDSTITYNNPGTLTVGRNRTLVIDASGYVSEADSNNTITCGDATGVDSNRFTSVTRTTNTCTFTIDPIDTLATSLQGNTTFDIPFSSDGGHNIAGTITVNVGPDSTVTFTDPGTFTVGRNRTLVIDALAATTGDKDVAAYTVSCADATGVDATKMAVTRSGCSFTVDPVDTLTPANQGDTTFSVAFASTAGATASGTFTVNIGPDSTITYTAPPSTGAGSLEVARNQTLEIDASSYVSESGSSYTITCSDARNLTVSRLTSVTRTANTCRYTITPNTSASTGNASFTITYTSTGGHSIVRTITLRVGPDSAISYNAPSGLSVAAGRGIAIAVSGYVSDGANTFTCADASGQDITDGHISVARNGCVFTVSAAASAAGENVTFTVLVTSSGGSSLSVNVPLAITAVSSIVFTDPAGGVNIGAGNSKVIDVGSFASDGTYTLQCRFNENTRHSRITSVTTNGCSFTVRAGTTQGAATLSVLYNSSGGDETTGVVSLNIGTSSAILFNVPGSSSLPVVAGGAAVTVNAGSYVTDGSYTITCGDATAVSATITVVRTGCSFRVTALASASGVVRFDVPYVSDGGNARSGTIRMAVSKIAYTAPVGLSMASRGIMVFDASEYATDGRSDISCSDATIPSSAHQARITSITRTGCSYEIRAANATGIVDISVPYTSTGGATATGVVRVNVGNIRALSSTNCSNGTFVDTTENPRVSGTNNDLVEDCQALVAMYENWRATAANSNLRSSYFLRTWGAGSASQRLVENWEGVTVTSGRVTGLDLENFGEEDGISGTIHTAIGNLRALTSLNLAAHQLSGGIPSQVYSLTSLTDLDLSYNSLSGTLSTSLGSLTALTSLILSDNGFTGGIPTQITSLTSLTNLDLGDNSLTGTIPTGIGSLTALTQLDLNDNSLTGGIPSGISSLTSLTNLFLNDNNLTGTIPTGIGSLTALTFLDLSDNNLTGTIPTQFGSLTVLVSLYLNDNRLQGSVPSQIATLITTDSGKLAALAICENQLTGALPTALRTPALLVDYPTADGYNPIACQNDPSSITFIAPTGLTIGRNYTLAINALDHATEADSNQTISCADATGVDASKMTVTRGTGANSCVFTVDPVNNLQASAQGATTFSVLFTSTGGDTETGQFTVNIGPDSNISYSSPGTLRLGRNRTLTIDASDYVSETSGSGYTISCADATGVNASRMSVTRTANTCSYTIDPVDTIGTGLQGNTTFRIVFTSNGGHSITRTITVNIGPDSAVTFTDPGTFTLGRNRTLVIDALAATTGDKDVAAYSVSCADATGVDATKMAVTRSGCSFTVDPVDTLVAGSQGDTTFTVAFTSTGGATASGTFTVNIGPDSTITYTPPPTTGANRLQIGRNLTLEIDASGYVSEASPSSYTISCSEARSIHVRLTSVTRAPNTCRYTIDPNNFTSSGTASFRVTFTSTGGHTVEGTISLRVGPNSQITFNAPPTSGANQLLVGRNQTLVVDAASYARETFASGYTISCGDATSIDSTRLTSVTHTGSSCSFTVTPISTLSSSLQTTAATFTVPYSSTGGDTANGIISVKIGPDSSLTFTAPTGLTVGRNRTLQIDALAATTGDKDVAAYTVSCANATGVDSTKMAVRRGSGARSCTFTVDPVNNLQAASQGNTTFSVAFTSTGGATASGTFTVNIGPDSTITFTPPTDVVVVEGGSVTVNAGTYAPDGSYTVTCGDATGVNTSRLTSVSHTGSSCDFSVNAASGASGSTSFVVPYISEGGHRFNGRIAVAISNISFTAPQSGILIGAGNTRTVNLASYARDGSFTITCGDATSVDSSKLTVTRNDCNYTIVASGSAAQGDTTFGVVYTSSGGDTHTATITITIGPASSIVFTPPAGLGMRTSTTLAINAANYARDGSYTIGCDGQATQVTPIIRVTRTAGTCRYTIRAVGSSGTASFTIAYTSTGGDTLQGTISLSIIADSTQTPTEPTPQPTRPDPPDEPSEETPEEPTDETPDTPSTTEPQRGPTTTLEPDQPGPRWNTLTVQPGGTTAQEIRRRLDLGARQDIYTWNTDTQTWTRVIRNSQVIPSGTRISFRTEEPIASEDLEAANLGGTTTNRLTTGWSTLSIPQGITRTDSRTFFSDASLTDCDNLQGIIVVANYSARSRQWSLWLPCHPEAQRRLTTGWNPQYRPLTSIAPGDTTYVYTRTRIPLTIRWDTETQTYKVTQES